MATFSTTRSTEQPFQPALLSVLSQHPSLLLKVTFRKHLGSCLNTEHLGEQDRFTIHAVPDRPR